MKQLILLLVCIQMGFASTYTLQSILQTADKKGVLSKALEEEQLFGEAKSRAESASDPFSLSASGAKAVPNVGDRGYEYAIGISKNIILGDIQDQERTIAGLNNQARFIEGEKEILSFRNGLKNIYHQHCLDLQRYESIKRSYAGLSTLYRKKQKAYTYQEISKIELMQLESEKSRLYAQLQELKMTQDISRQKVLMLSRVGERKHHRLSCQDMYPIRLSVPLEETFSLSKEAYSKRVESTKVKFKRYSHAIESVNIGGQYGKELDIDRYTIGISMPLAFSSERSEQERAAALYSSSALAYRYEQEMLEKRSLLFELRSRLKSQASMVNILSKNYHKYRKKLLPMVKRSYELGEISVIEYLLSRQKFYALNAEIYAAKKAYYTTLFTLYTVSEKKDKK